MSVCRSFIPTHQQLYSRVMLKKFYVFAFSRGYFSARL
jgi:hypothetical protein